MPLTERESISLSPRLIKLIVKVVKFSKGGFSKEERQELASDLLDLSVHVMTEATD